LHLDNYHHKNQEHFDYSGKDPTNNISYEEKGTSKISIDIIVPDYLVSLLIGKNGECIRGIMSKSGSMITFQKDVILTNHLISINSFFIFMLFFHIKNTNKI